MIVTAQQNDTIDLICLRHLGATAAVTEQALRMNPHIDGSNPVLALGTPVALPDKRPPVKKTVNLWD